MRRIAIATAAAATLLLVGCQKPAEQAPAATAEQAAPVERVSAPTDNNPEGWKAFMRQELQPHMDQRRFRRPFSYFIPLVDATAPDAAEQQRQFDAQAEAVENAVGRGIQAGTMLAFAGPDSAAIASVIENAFKLAAPQSLKGVRIVVIAKPEVRPQIEAAIVPSGAEFIYVDLQ